jgi:hypothetical protein
MSPKLLKDNEKMRKHSEIVALIKPFHKENEELYNLRLKRPKRRERKTSEKKMTDRFE